MVETLQYYNIIPVNFKSEFLSDDLDFKNIHYIKNKFNNLAHVFQFLSTIQPPESGNTSYFNSL